MAISIFDTVINGISIIGSIVGTRQDLAEVFALHLAGRTRVVSETRELGQVNDAIAEVLSGKVTARLVFDFQPATALPVVPGAEVEIGRTGAPELLTTSNHS